jgi:thiol-disulfide isomerase/thioredoxin
MSCDTIKQKYLKYKIKYNVLKNKKLNLIGGSNKEENKKTVYLFKAEWCGHCRDFKKTWESLQSKYKKINFITYDYDKNKKQVEDAKIESFPTIILKTKDNKAIQYVGPRDMDSLGQFIEKN